MDSLRYAAALALEQHAPHSLRVMVGNALQALYVTRTTSTFLLSINSVFAADLVLQLL